MHNQECTSRSETIHLNTDEPVFYPYSITINKCCCSCNNINDPYEKLCVPDTIKNINLKVFNLMSRTNETRHIKWHETCKCKCRLSASICNSRQTWTEDKCRCECKELIDKGICDKGFIWNPSTCERECDKSCDIGEYLDYKNCKCRYKLADKLVEEYTKIVDENEMIYNETLNTISSNDYKCSSCTLYIVSFAVFLVTIVIVGTVFVCFYWYLKKEDNVSRIKFNPNTTHALIN